MHRDEADQLMSDDEFARAFLAGTLSVSQFHHRDHLRLGWVLVRQQGVESATQAVVSGIRRFAAHHGQATKYHETVTLFWVRLVGHLVATRPDLAAFDAFMGAFPHLLDKNLPYRHWRRATMESPAARAGWVAPDLLPLSA